MVTSQLARSCGDQYPDQVYVCFYLIERLDPDVRMVRHTIKMHYSLSLNVNNFTFSIALRSGSTIADEVYPRRGYC